MQRLIVTLTLLVTLALGVVPAWAACTTHTYYSNGRTKTCTTCCYGGNCTTTCQWIGRQRSATRIASEVIVLSADSFGSQSPPLGNLRRVFVFATVVGDGRQPRV